MRLPLRGVCCVPVASNVRPNMHTRSALHCLNCKLRLPDEWLADSGITPCPACESVARDIRVTLAEQLPGLPTMGLRAQSRDPSLPSKKKLRHDQFTGTEARYATGGLVRKTRVIDKDKDLYMEKVVDLDSGEILVDKEEKLSEHQGHGSAKLR